MLDHDDGSLDSDQKDGAFDSYQRALGNLRAFQGGSGGFAEVPSLDEHEKPLKGSRDGQHRCNLKETLTDYQLPLSGRGYIGGFLLTLWGFRERDHNRILLGAGFIGLDAVGTVGGMGLIVLCPLLIGR